MASEYFKYLARDEKPDAPSPPRTRKQKLQNWFHYNWIWLAIAAVLLWITGSMLWNVLGIGKVKPDHVFAYIGEEPLQEEQAKLFEEEISAYAADVNGDGKVTVELKQYATNRKGDLETVLYYNYAADTQLLADITAGDSYFFLLEDPEGIQHGYQILAAADGSAPAYDDYEAEGKVLAWTDCPVLANLKVDQNIFSNLFLGRRYFAGDAAQRHANDEAFWNVLTEGAKN